MDPFWSMVLITFVLGALVVIGATMLGERLGTKVGGIIGTLPHLVIIALYFIGITQGPDFASRATTSIPVTIGINALFLYIFYRIARWKVILAPVLSLGIWVAMAVPIVLLDLDNIFLSVVLYLILVPVAYLLFEKVSDVPERSLPKMRYTARMLSGRGVLAGGMIAFAVIISEYGGAVLGGIFSVFPALFLSTMLIYSMQHDAEYAGAMGKTMAIGGNSVFVYALCGHFLFPVLGMVLGSLIGFLISVVAAIGIYPIVKRMN